LVYDEASLPAASAGRRIGRKLERLMVQFVISPSKEEAANFTMNDWANFKMNRWKLWMLSVLSLGHEEGSEDQFPQLNNVGGLHSDSSPGRFTSIWLLPC
jgi:hypothetical protein